MPKVETVAKQKEQGVPFEPEGSEGVPPDPDPAPEPEGEREGEGINILEWLKTPTGGGNIEEYLDQPLNFDGSYAMARVLRGLTGFFDHLDLAVFDVAIGLYQHFLGGSGDDDRESDE